MSDEIGASQNFSSEMAREIIKLGKGLWDSRSVARQDVKKKNIDPLLEEIRESHEDFSRSLGGLEEILRRLARFIDDRQNDSQEFLKERVEKIEEIYQHVYEKRAQRRATFSTSKALREELKTKKIGKKLLFSQDELDKIMLFHENLESYLSRDERTYGHDLGHIIQRVDRLLRRASRSADDFLKSEIAANQAFLQRYREERDSIWLEISYAYARISP